MPLFSVIVGGRHSTAAAFALASQPEVRGSNLTSEKSEPIVIFQLERPVVASWTVSFACLPPDVSQTFAGTQMVISGWGYVVDKGNQSPDLKAAFVTGYQLPSLDAKEVENILVPFLP